MKKCPSCKKEVDDNAQVCPQCGYSFISDEPTFVNFSDIYFPELDIIKEKLSNKYRVIGLIGRGGFSTVLKLKDTVLDRICALKILSRELILDPEMLERFKREARLYAKLDHPNIVQVYDVGFYKNVAYIIMKYIDGITLKELIKERAPLTLDEILRISEDIASVLEYMHSKGIIHRDIKPANIMIQKSDGRAILTDFGLAKNLETTKFTATGKIMGSPHYLAPEQAKGEKVDERTDIYSLGITMFEMATGKLPFEGETAVQIVLKHIREDLPRPSEFNKDINPALENIILKATKRTPEERFSSVKEFKEALKKVNGDETLYIETEGKGKAGFFKYFFILLVLVGLLGVFSYKTGYFKSFFNKKVEQSEIKRSEKGFVKSLEKKSESIKVEKSKTPSHLPNPSEKVSEKVADKSKTLEQEKQKAVNQNIVNKKEKPKPIIVSKPNLFSVRFSSNVKTKLYIDDRFYGVIPPSKNVKLKKGKHKVMYLRETPKGIKSFVKEIVVNEKTKSVNQIFNVDAIIKKIVAVPWAKVYIDGKLKDITPIFNIKLKEGYHTIIFKHPEFKDLSKRIYVAGGESIDKVFVNLNLESRKIVKKKVKAIVNNYKVNLIYVFPWGDVYFDGKKLGTSPINQFSVRGGEHIIKVKHPKYGILEKTINIKKDIRKISINLQTKVVKIEEE